MTKQWLLDQCVQMGILQYPGQQSQYQNQQQNQQQQYNPADMKTRRSNAEAKKPLEWSQERTFDVSRVKVTANVQHINTTKAQNSHLSVSTSLFMGQLEEQEVPISGGTAEQSKQLKQLIDKWCGENEPIITSLRNTFESGRRLRRQDTAHRSREIGARSSALAAAARCRSGGRGCTIRLQKTRGRNRNGFQF